MTQKVGQVERKNRLPECGELGRRFLQMPGLSLGGASPKTAKSPRVKKNRQTVKCESPPGSFDRWGFVFSSSTVFRE
jgi:hypothetical protein